MKVLYSIIIPTFNREKTIARAVNSVLNQTYQYWELIIVDDGGKDNTRIVVEELIQNNNDRRIRYFKFPNMGANVARNIGIGLANGRLIAFLDSDDIWENKRLEVIAKRYDPKNPSLYFTDFKFEGDTETKVEEKYLVSDLPTILKSHNVIGGTSNYVVDRSIFERINGFDIKLSSCQDLDFLNLICENYHFTYIKGVSTIFFRDTTNRISNKNYKKLNGHIEFYKKHRSQMSFLNRILNRKKIALVGYQSKSILFLKYLVSWATIWLLVRINKIKDERDLYLRKN